MFLRICQPATVFTVVLASVPFSAFADFSDVPTDHPNFSAVRYVEQKGIVGGYEDKTYRPEEPINRAELTKIVMEAIYASELCDAKLEFPDVPQEEWFTRYVCLAKQYAVVGGYPDGTFKPEQTVIVAEAAKIIVTALGFETEESDIWYEEYINVLKERHAFPASIGSLDAELTRGEMAEMIFRLQTGEAFSEEAMETTELAAVAPAVDAESSFNTRSYEYRLRYENEIVSDLSADRGWDAELIRRNRETGEEEVIVESVKGAIVELREPFNLTLQSFAHPDDADVIIFKSVLMETDNLAGSLYSFDVDTHIFGRMKINEIYDGFFGGFGLAPDETKFIWAPNTNEEGDAKEMFLVDLLSDSYNTVVNLSASETLNGGWYAFMASFDVRWMDENTVRYAVYDQTKKVEPYGAPFIEYRLIEVQE